MEPKKPDLSWWSEGLFIVAIFPPLIPTWIGMSWSDVSMISCLLIPAIFLSAVVVTILPATRLRSRLKAVLGGTAIGTLLLIGWCMYN